MPSAAQRRRRTIQDDEDESEQEEEVTRGTQRNRRQAPDSADESDRDEDDEGGGEQTDVDAPDGEDQMVKKLVRYALACEFQRTTIKRTGITEKVIGKQRVNFKKVFESAQKQLQRKFGMHMMELPAREKVTLTQKRAAQKTKGGSKAPTSYISTTILPTEYRIPEIMPPSNIGSTQEEAAYMGLCSVIVSIIALTSGGQISDHKLMLHLKRLNAEKNTGLDTTPMTLKKMINQGYIAKVVERSADEDTVEWIVGPRGKIEIGSTAIRGLVTEVYGENAPDDLDKRLQRSLGMEMKHSNANQEEEASEEEAPANGDPGPSNPGTRGRKRRVAVEED